MSESEVQEPTVERLLATLKREGSVFDLDWTKGLVVTFSRYRRTDLEFPTVVKTTPEHFLAYLDHTGPEASGLWECGPREAAYRLLLVHLDEEFDSLHGNPDTIQIGPTDMRAFRSRPSQDPLRSLPPGDYEWRAGSATI